MQIPLVGLGTYELIGDLCVAMVKRALELGYHHIDTAHVYNNHREIKKGIEGFVRQDLFLTSKLALKQVDLGAIASSVEKSCDQALKELGVDYLDLYLIHWPDHSIDLHQIFSAMETLVKKGKVRFVGVSNFTEHHLNDLLKEGCIPHANQVEFHPYLYQKELLNYCKQRAIQLIAHRSFGRTQLFQEPLFEKIAKIHHRTVPQVILRWILHKGVVVIPKASSEEHLRENLGALTFSLSEEEIEKIDALHRNKRFCKAHHPEFFY